MIRFITVTKNLTLADLKILSAVVTCRTLLICTRLFPLLIYHDIGLSALVQMALVLIPVLCRFARKVNLFTTICLLMFRALTRRRVIRSLPRSCGTRVILVGVLVNLLRCLLNGTIVLVIWFVFLGPKTRMVVLTLGALARRRRLYDLVVWLTRLLLN